MTLVYPRSLNNQKHFETYRRNAWCFVIKKHLQTRCNKGTESREQSGKAEWEGREVLGALLTAVPFAYSSQGLLRSPHPDPRVVWRWLCFLSVLLCIICCCHGYQRPGRETISQSCLFFLQNSNRSKPMSCHSCFSCRLSLEVLPECMTST